MIGTTHALTRRRHSPLPSKLVLYYLHERAWAHLPID
jgi:hypothetical protein